MELGSREEEGEGEVGEDCDGDEAWGRAEGLALDPCEVVDGWVVDKTVLESGEYAVHCVIVHAPPSAVVEEIRPKCDGASEC